MLLAYCTNNPQCLHELPCVARSSFTSCLCIFIYPCAAGTVQSKSVRLHSPFGVLVQELFYVLVELAIYPEVLLYVTLS